MSKGLNSINKAGMFSCCIYFFISTDIDIVKGITISKFAYFKIPMPTDCVNIKCIKTVLYPLTGFTTAVRDLATLFLRFFANPCIHLKP